MALDVLQYFKNKGIAIREDWVEAYIKWSNEIGVCTLAKYQIQCKVERGNSAQTY